MRGINRKKTMTEFIFIWVGLLFIVVLLSSVVMITYIAHHAAEESVSLSLGKELRRYKLYIRTQDSFTDEELNDLIEMENCHIVILDDEGHYIRGIYDEEMETAVSAAVNTSMRVREIESGEQDYYILDRSIKKSDVEKTGGPKDEKNTGKPDINNKHGTDYYIRAIAAVDSIDTMYHELQQKYYMILALLSVIFVLVLLYVYNKVMRPVNEIVEKAKQISESHTYSERMSEDEKFYETEVFTKAYNRLLDHTEKLVDQQEKFNSDISHELRTPVSLILSECDLMQEMYRDEMPQETMKSFDLIKNQCYRMKDMITELLYLSKLDQENVTDRFECIDVLEILESIYEDSELLLQGSRVLEKDFSSVNAEVDLPLIMIAIRNLVTNAVKFSDEGSVIKISDKYDNDNIYISVSDNGRGISKEQQEKIFDCYYQVSGERNNGGFGLGLTLALRIAKIHGGRIDVQSDVGKGSVFTIVLPRAKEEK